MFRKKISSFLALGLLPFLLSSCSHLFYYPDRVLYAKPTRFGYPYKELTFKSTDGTKLIGWWIPTKNPNPKGTVVLFHGNGENLSSHFYSLLWMVGEGYNLFAFSYRGYAGSEGDPDQLGTIQDGVAALNQAYEFHQASETAGAKDNVKDGAKGKFIAYGQSLGGAILARSLSEFSHKDEVSYLVLDSTFMSYPKCARRVLQSHWSTFLFSPIAYLLISNKGGSEESVRANAIPLLVIHDRRDPTVAFSNGEEVFEAAKSPKEFWILNEGKHVGVFDPPGGDNRKKFLALLEAIKPIKNK